jgi:hypothetical protein
LASGSPCILRGLFLSLVELKKIKPMKKQLLLNFLFGLILLGCTNNKSYNDVLIAKSQLTIDECWVELLSPFEFDTNKVGNLVVYEFLKYRVGLIQIESLEVLLKSVKDGNQISIPSKDVMITPPPKTPNESRRQEYLALYYHPTPVVKEAPVRLLYEELTKK